MPLNSLRYLRVLGVSAVSPTFISHLHTEPLPEILPGNQSDEIGLSAFASLAWLNRLTMQYEKELIDRSVGENYLFHTGTRRKPGLFLDSALIS